MNKIGSSLLVQGDPKINCVNKHSSHPKGAKPNMVQVTAALRTTHAREG